LNVTVYSTPTCPYCHKAKDFLNSKSIKFKDMDVTSNKDYAKDNCRCLGQSLAEHYYKTAGSNTHKLSSLRVIN